MLIAECARSKRQLARKNKLRVDVEARHDPLKPTHARIALAAPSQKSNEAGAGRRQRAQEIAEIVGQRASPPTPARANQRLVSDEPEGEADQDRCEGGLPRTDVAFQKAEAAIHGRCSKRFCG